MKKIILVVFMCLLTISLTGCGKDKEKVADIEKSLYSNKTQLVYDVNGLYKMVYYYENGKITGLKHFYDCETKEKATDKLVKDKEELKYNSTIKSITQEGKFVIYTMSDDQYKDLTIEQVKENYSSFLTEVTK